MIEIKDKTTFFELQKKLNRIPFTQSRGWCDYLLCCGKQIVFFVDSVQNPKITCWGIAQKIPFSSKKILRIEGESYINELSEKIFKNFYSNLLNIGYQGIEINSNNTFNLEFEIGIRRSGFIRPLGSFSCPLTIEIDFNIDFKFDNNWKRNVKKALKFELKFQELIDISTKETKQISDMFKELANLKGLGFHLETESLQILLASNDIRTFMVYNNKNHPVAARIVHVNNLFATDIFAANSLEARKCGATYFIMQHIFETLKEEGFQTFDFGRIPPSNLLYILYMITLNTSK